MSFDMQTLSKTPAEEHNGILVVPIGSIDVGEKGKEIEIVRINGGKILYATTTIEKN